MNSFRKSNLQNIKNIFKEKALGALVGQTMKAMKGKANPGMVNQKLREMLK